jgi:hypothetical protein
MGNMEDLATWHGTNLPPTQHSNTIHCARICVGHGLS